MLKKWFSGLKKTQENILGRLNSLIRLGGDINETFYEELEEILITADLGVRTSMDLVSDIRKLVKERKIKEREQVTELIREVLTGILESNSQELHLNKKGLSIILLIGVNGVGKTTTAAKLGNHLKEKGLKVMFAAGDTFRAGAIEQLKLWGDRLGIPVIAQQEGSDPAAVIFDVIEAAKARGMDVLVIDTAGRLHNKKNLMEEMKKINKVVQREDGRLPEEIFLIVDAGTGQNALTSAEEFKKNVPEMTGIILTKLDGTAKGGIVIPMIKDLKIPVKFVGVGESVSDLEPFSAESFVEGLFGEDKE